MPASLVPLEPLLVSPLCGVVRELRRIHKDPSEPLEPFIYRAELSNHLFQSGDDATALHCSGKGFSDDEARTSALGEAIERYGGSCQPRDGIRVARRDALEGESLDPRALVLYADFQYPNLPYARYDADTELGWVRGRRWGDDAPVWIPAVGVMLAYEVDRHGEFLCPLTSNGLAAGPTFEAAVLSAACEVLERDAFMATWWHRLPALRVDPMTHPDPRVRALCASHARRGVACTLHKLATDHPVHVFLALGVQQDGEGPAAVVGLGADLDAARAARGALLEVAQVRPALRMRMREEAAAMARLVADPASVRTLQDHDLLYADRAMLPAFDFLRDAPLAEMDWTPCAVDDPADGLRELAAHLATSGTFLHAVDLTPPEFAPLGLHVARAILPGFQPIHFGHGEPRLGGTRVFDLPRKLGLRAGACGPHDINPLPHPLS